MSSPVPQSPVRHRHYGSRGATRRRVLAGPVFVGAAFLLGHQRPTRPPVVMCAVVPLPIEAATPHRLAPDCRRRVPEPPAKRRAGGGEIVESCGQAYQTIDTLHSEVHGNAMPGTLVDWVAEPMRSYSSAFPRSNTPGPMRLPRSTSLGPLSATGSQAPLPDWWSDLDGTRPVIPSLRAPLPTPTTGSHRAYASRALPMTMSLVVVTTGNRALDTRCHRCHRTRAAAHYLPYDELLPRTVVYVDPTAATAASVRA